jgi:hypothetical protein
MSHPRSIPARGDVAASRGDHNAWGTFRRDAFRWFIRADDETALFTLIERRQQPMFAGSEALRCDPEAAP